MYTLEQNTSGLIDLKVERDALEARMQAMGLDIDQTRFDLAKLKTLIATEQQS
jgi:hypothetical protein